MNFEAFPSRRDVVAFVTYAALAYNVLSALFHFLAQLVLHLFSLFRTSWSGDVEYYGISLVASFVFSLAFWPFVPLIASGVAGTHSAPPMTKRDLFPLMSCVGVMLFVLSFPDLAYSGYYRVKSQLPGRSGGGELGYYLREAATSLVCASIGFALAFFPAIFRALRASALE